MLLGEDEMLLGVDENRMQLGPKTRL